MCSVGCVCSGDEYGSPTTCRSSGHGYMVVLQNSQKFRVGTRMLYIPVRVAAPGHFYEVFEMNYSVSYVPGMYRWPVAMTFTAVLSIR